jgi:predicted PurR-regulated permease PerM
MKSDNGKKKVDIVGLNEIIDLSNRILKITYFFLFIIVIYALTALLKEWHIFTFLFLLLKVLSPLFIGLIIAWFLEPFVTFLSDRGVYRFLGVILVYLILITFLYIIMVTAFPLLLKQSNEVLTIFPILIEKLNLWLNNFFRGFEKISFLDLELIRTDTLEYFSLIIKSLTTDIPEIIFNSLKAVLSTVGVVLFGLIIGFYLLFDFNNIGKRILTIMPKRIRNDLKYLYAEINISLLSYIKGTIFISVILFF